MVEPHRRRSPPGDRRLPCRARADVIALQEVALLTRTARRSTRPASWPRQLGMDVRYGAVRTFSATDADGAAIGAGVFGNALLSTEPMTVGRGRSPCRLPPPMPSSSRRGPIIPRPGSRTPMRPPTSASRAACCWPRSVRGGSGPLTSATSGSGERRLQAEACAAAFDGARPALLLGDLNAAIDAPELEPLSGWTDAFAEPRGDDRADLDRRRLAHRPGAGAGRIGPWACASAARGRRPERPLSGRGGAQRGLTAPHPLRGACVGCTHRRTNGAGRGSRTPARAPGAQDRNQGRPSEVLRCRPTADACMWRPAEPPTGPPRHSYVIRRKRDVD